ncbi:hypothetical protein LCGC14_2900060, partial [marine sediment metagenome]
MTEPERIFDYTAIDTFQTCRRKFYWSMVKDIQLKHKSNTLLFGGAVHECLVTHYTEGNEAAIKRFGLEYKDVEGDDLRTVANGEKLMRVYGEVYKHEPFTLSGKPEIGFVIPLSNCMYGGRIDLPIEWDGMWVMEHKHTASLTPKYFRQFDLCKQVTGYIVGLEEYTGKKCTGCMVNVLQPWKEVKRVTAKTKKPEDHYLRCPVTRSPELKSRWKTNIERIVRDIKWCESNDEWYEAEKKEMCFYYNVDCPYKTLCQYGYDERIIKRDFIIAKWKPYEERRKEVK